MAQLIQKKFKVKLGVTAVGKLLATLGLTPQKPLQRAYQRDPEAIEKRQRERYPAIAQQAREEKADVFFWDESGFRADAVHGKTWGIRGKTPVVGRPGQRQSISAASVVDASIRTRWFGAMSGEQAQHIAHCKREKSLKKKSAASFLKSRINPISFAHFSMPPLSPLFATAE